MQKQFQLFAISVQFSYIQSLTPTSSSALTHADNCVRYQTRGETRIRKAKIEKKRKCAPSDRQNAWTDLISLLIGRGKVSAAPFAQAETMQLQRFLRQKSGAWSTRGAPGAAPTRQKSRPAIIITYFSQESAVHCTWRVLLYIFECICMWICSDSNMRLSRGAVGDVCAALIDRDGWSPRRRAWKRYRAAAATVCVSPSLLSLLLLAPIQAEVQKSLIALPARFLISQIPFDGNSERSIN